MKKTSDKITDDKIHIYKLRADDWRSRYEGMRDLEWKVLIQVYAGYAAIAVSFANLSHPAPKLLSILTVLAMVFTLLFYIDSVPQMPFFRATLIARHNSARTGNH